MLDQITLNKLAQNKRNFEKELWDNTDENVVYQITIKLVNAQLELVGYNTELLDKFDETYLN